MTMGNGGGGGVGDIVYVYDIYTKRIKFIEAKLLLTCVPLTLHSFKCLFQALCVCVDESTETFEYRSELK